VFRCRGVECSVFHRCNASGYHTPYSQIHRKFRVWKQLACRSWSLKASKTKIKKIRLTFIYNVKHWQTKINNLLTDTCLSVALAFTPSGFQPILVNGTVPVPVAFNVTEYTLPLLGRRESLAWFRLTSLGSCTPFTVISFSTRPALISFAISFSRWFRSLFSSYKIRERKNQKVKIK
jgi:hypothetical protein